MSPRLRSWALHEPLPPQDRVSYLEARIRGARFKIAEMKCSCLGKKAYFAEIDRLRRQIFEWRRELRELRL